MIHENEFRKISALQRSQYCQIVTHSLLTQLSYLQYKHIQTFAQPKVLWCVEKKITTSSKILYISNYVVNLLDLKLSVKFIFPLVRFSDECFSQLTLVKFLPLKHTCVSIFCYKTAAPHKVSFSTCLTLDDSLVNK